MAVLQYYEPPGLRHWQRRRLSLQVQTVLLGTQPLSWASAAATAAFSSKARQAAPALSQAPGVTARAAAQSGAARLGVAPSDRVANVDSTKVGGSLNAAVDLARGTALACQPNVECNSEWAAEANAVVLLVGVEAAEDTGFYCTGGWLGETCDIHICWREPKAAGSRNSSARHEHSGALTACAPSPAACAAATLINSPTGEQLLVSANHCLGYASASDTEILWQVGPMAGGPAGMRCVVPICDFKEMLVADGMMCAESHPPLCVCRGVLVNYDLRCGSRSGTRPPQYMLLQVRDALERGGLASRCLCITVAPSSSVHS